ncbi:MAG: hypothetical protein WA364_00875 [Candidatus Nitrosopolaris sp.]
MGPEAHSNATAAMTKELIVMVAFEFIVSISVSSGLLMQCHTFDECTTNLSNEEVFFQISEVFGQT